MSDYVDVVEQITRAQFGAAFAEFSVLRRRRAELEYPGLPGREETAGPTR